MMWLFALRARLTLTASMASTYSTKSRETFVINAWSNSVKVISGIVPPNLAFKNCTVVFVTFGRIGSDRWLKLEGNPPPTSVPLSTHTNTYAKGAIDKVAQVGKQLGVGLENEIAPGELAVVGCANPINVPARSSVGKGVRLPARPRYSQDVQKKKEPTLWPRSE